MVDGSIKPITNQVSDLNPPEIVEKRNRHGFESDVRLSTGRNCQMIVPASDNS